MFRWFLATLALTATVSSATAAFVVTVIPSVGPDVSNPSFANYAALAIPGIRAGTGNGVPGSPQSYAPSGTAQGGGAINYLIPPLGGGVTGLWNGQPNPPNAVYGPNYAGQTGNWVYFGLAIRSTVPGQTFTASDVNWSGFYSFDGALGPVNLSTSAGFGSPTIQGASTIGGPLSPVANATTPVQELYYVGIGYSIGNSFGAGDYTDPASLYNLMFNPSTPSGILSGNYTISNAFGSGSGAGGVDINGAPAPATLALMGFGLAGLIARRVRRARTA